MSELITVGMNQFSFSLHTSTQHIIEMIIQGDNIQSLYRNTTTWSPSFSKDLIISLRLSSEQQSFSNTILIHIDKALWNILDRLPGILRGRYIFPFH